MYKYICTYAYTCSYTNTYMYIYTYTCIYIDIYIHIHIYSHMQSRVLHMCRLLRNSSMHQRCDPMYIYIYLSIHVYVYIYISIYIQIYKYIYIRTCNHVAYVHKMHINTKTQYTCIAASLSEFYQSGRIQIIL